MSGSFLIRAMMASTLLCALPLGLVACKPGTSSAPEAAPAAAAKTSLDARLSEPQVGDLWATEISHFSAGEFG